MRGGGEGGEKLPTLWLLRRAPMLAPGSGCPDGAAPGGSRCPRSVCRRRVPIFASVGFFLRTDPACCLSSVLTSPAAAAARKRSLGGAIKPEVPLCRSTPASPSPYLRSIPESRSQSSISIPLLYSDPSPASRSHSHIPVPFPCPAPSLPCSAAVLQWDPHPKADGGCSPGPGKK